MLRVGIVGASGYTGTELLRLCAAHPEFEVVVATGDSMAGTRLADLYPNLAPAYGDLEYRAYDAAEFVGLDVVVMGLPHGTSQPIVSELLGKVGVVADMGADFRLDEASLYDEWYGAPHTCPELLGQMAYGLPELYRDQLAGARGIAVPGCNPTAACLAMAPFTRAGLLDTGPIIVDIAAGVSGAGRGPKANTTFCTVDENYEAYGILTHRHTPEMEQVLGVSVLFQPHLAPMSRGILATCYARPRGEMTSTDAMSAMQRFYSDEPFITVDERSPSTKATMGSNQVHMTARVDPRTGTLIAIAAIDNLTKGSAGGAVQSINVALGLEETAGLPQIGLFP
ncbi:MAG: N-acetyl-gamma-glutamyl-phosphate reductase [Actinomycetia bacterium]|nr:N-acetyl-gamma-glutamyl-phosphate reductase [Actinomycetes bacterium]